MWISFYKTSSMTGYWRNCGVFLLNSALHLDMKNWKCDVKSKLFTKIGKWTYSPTASNSLLTNIKTIARGDTSHCSANVLASTVGYLSTNIYSLQKTSMGEYALPPHWCWAWPFDFPWSHGEKNMLSCFLLTIILKRTCHGELLLQRDTSSLNQTWKLEPSLTEPVLGQLQLTSKCVSKKLMLVVLC